MLRFTVLNALLLLSVMVCLCMIVCSAGAATRTDIDLQKSSMTVRVFKAGLFSAFGHEHEINAPIQQGSFTEGNPWVELTVDARKLR